MKPEITVDPHLADLERRVYNLTKLVDINGIINSTLDIGKLLTIIMEIIKDIMETEASTLLLYDESRKELVFKVALGEAGRELVEKYRVQLGQGIAGWVAENLKPLYVNDVYSDPRFDPAFDQRTGFVTKSILCTPLLFKGKLLGVIQAVNPLNRPGFTDEDMNLFKIFANQAALAVQNAIYFHNALEEERIRIELGSARAIQDSLIPDLDAEFVNFQIASKTLTAREVGGEFNALFRYSSTQIGLVICDIHNKGIPGALRASMISGLAKAVARVKGGRPDQFVRTVRKLASQDLGHTDPFSVFYGVIDLSSRLIRFVNSGTAYPVLVKNSSSRYLRLGDAADTFSIKSAVVSLAPGDLFVVLTDGILNVKNPDGNTYGLKRAMGFLENSFDNAESAIELLIEDARSFSRGVGLREDITVFMIKSV
jgi:sigma-B regulation protein RsbU (phosphoserine phosphatase)